MNNSYSLAGTDDSQIDWERDQRMQMVLRKYRLTSNNLQQSVDSNKPTVKVNMMGSNAFEREFNMT